MKRHHRNRSPLRWPRLGAVSRYALLGTVALASLHSPAPVAALERLSQPDLALGSIEVANVSADLHFSLPAIDQRGVRVHVSAAADLGMVSGVDASGPDTGRGR